MLLSDLTVIDLKHYILITLHHLQITEMFMSSRDKEASLRSRSG